jgi:hypothetical protein
MAHFAELNEENIVTRVIVIDNKELMNPVTGKEEELRGIFFCENLLGGRWIQTSYNNKFRNCYAGVGFTYNEELDIFIPPKPFNSWIFNTETKMWESPFGPEPELSDERMEMGDRYIWNEDSIQWELVNILN